MKNPGKLFVPTQKIRNFPKMAPKNYKIYNKKSEKFGTLKIKKLPILTQENL